MSIDRSVAVTLLLFATVVSAAGQSSAPLPYTLAEGWGRLPEGEAWGEVTGVEIDSRGTIIALRRSNPPFVELDRSGKVLKTWGNGMFVWPHGFRIDRDGNLWVTDGRGEKGRGQQVFKLTRDGRVLMTLGTAGVSGEGNDTFNGPCDVAIGANGDIFVADGHVNARVVKFTRDGKFVKAWGKRGTAAGEFNVPHAIAIDSQGRVFVADRGNRRLQIFDQDGKFLDEWTQFGRPSGILITSDDTLYVPDIQDKQGVVVGSAKSGVVGGVIAGTLPESVAIDGDGSLYAGETTTGRTLRKFVRR
jgi:streptogramin lyase